MSQTNRKYTVRFCWTCGHFAKAENQKCECCNHRIATRKPKGDTMFKIMQNMNECLSGKKDPEYRFYTLDGVFFVRGKTLKAYEELKNDVKHEKYYHFIKSVLNSGEIAFVSRILFDGSRNQIKHLLNQFMG